MLGIAAAARLIGLEQPGELVFDETYYVKDAESLRQLGYEGRWPEGANELWAAGTPGSPSELASFVAHPPFGKWVIAIGLGALGPEDPAGWRLGTAVAGVVLVGLVMLLAHLLLGRLVLTGIAGLLIAVDGNAIVMSRVALLDGVLALLVVLAVIFVVLIDGRRAAHSTGGSTTGGRAIPRAHATGGPRCGAGRGSSPPASRSASPSGLSGAPSTCSPRSACSPSSPTPSTGVRPE